MDDTNEFITIADRLIAESRKELVKEKHITPEVEGRARYLSVLAALGKARKKRVEYRKIVAYLLTIIIDENLMYYAEGENSSGDALQDLLYDLVQEELDDNPSSGQVSEWTRIQTEMIPALRKIGVPLDRLVIAFYGGGKSKLRDSAVHYTHLMTTPMPPKKRDEEMIAMLDQVMDEKVSRLDFNAWSGQRRHKRDQARRVRDIAMYQTKTYTWVVIKIPSRWVRTLELRLGTLIDQNIPTMSMEYLIDMLYKAAPLKVIRAMNKALGLLKSDLLEKYYEDLAKQTETND
jgi:hypothetical protein